MGMKEAILAKWHKEICNAAIISDLQLHSTLPTSELLSTVWVSHIKNKQIKPQTQSRHRVRADQQPSAPAAQADTWTASLADLILLVVLKLLSSQLILLPVQNIWFRGSSLLDVAKGYGMKGAVAAAFRHS